MASTDCTREDEGALLSHSPDAVDSVQLAFFFRCVAGLKFNCQSVAEPRVSHQNRGRAYFESGVCNPLQVTVVRRGHILFTVLSPELSSWSCPEPLQWSLTLV